MITIELQTNASLLQCVIPGSSPNCFLTAGWKSCHKLPSCLSIAVFKNGWGGHVLVMCSDIILVKQEILTLDIHVSHQHECEDTCIGANNIRWWINLLKDRNTDIACRHHSGQLQTASAEENKGKFNLIRENWCMPVKKWQQRFR